MAVAERSLGKSSFLGAETSGNLFAPPFFELEYRPRRRRLKNVAEPIQWIGWERGGGTIFVHRRKIMLLIHSVREEKGSP